MVGVDMIVEEDRRQTWTDDRTQLGLGFNQVPTPLHNVPSAGRNTGRVPLLLSVVSMKTSRVF